jgi:thiamine pyrophosphate-dependent acetolactate synthase large subunit-like protein
MFEKVKLHRRRFLSGAAIAGGAALVSEAGAQVHFDAGSHPPKASPPTAAHMAAERNQPPELDKLTAEKTGSDFMVDVCKTLDIGYIAACPGSTFRGLQESFINYGRNFKPEWLTCLHEEVSAGLAHGYAKVAGKPMAAIMHGTVGVQHASMAIYNAWCDRVPILLLTASAGPVEDRRPGVEWMHSVQDGAATVRDFVKWDDYPWSLQSFAESVVRAYTLATAHPQAPVLITADGKLQEMELSKEANAKLKIPKFNRDIEPVADQNALREAAQMLAAAQNPVITADRYARSQNGVDMLVKLAETLQAPVIDLHGRMNFPNTHYLSQWERSGALLAEADCILAIEPADLYGQFHRIQDQLERRDIPRIKANAKVICLSTRNLMVKSNYQDFQRYHFADLMINADGEASMPYLIEAALKETAGSKPIIEARGHKLREAFGRIGERARLEASYAWDASPISSARLYAELYDQIKGLDWALVSESFFSSHWPHRLWPIEKFYQHIGGSGGAGVGYQPCASLGAALAHRDAGGRFVVSVTGDGEFNMAPHTLWTAAHHNIPFLTIVQNNRAYHQEVMHLQRMANRHNRGIDRTHIGVAIRDPNISYAKIAEGYGAVGIGPVSHPGDLRDAMKKGIDAVTAGHPVLIDAVMQPR